MTTEQPRMPMRWFGSFYVGIGAGAGIPTQAIRQAYNPGVSVAVPIGWDAPIAPLGFRVDLGYTRFDARNTFRSSGTTFPGSGTSGSAVLANADPQVWSALANLKLRVPFLGTFFSPLSGLYAVAGGGLNHFRNYNTTFGFTNPEFGGGTSTTTSSSETLTRGALDAGGGIAWGFGRSEVFLESRYVTTFMEHERASYVPIILGVNFR